MREQDIQRAILDYLLWNKKFCWKQNTVGIRKPNGSYIPASTTGIPDITCIIDGRYCGIEVKSKKGRLSDNQKEFQSKVEKAGGQYIVACAISDVEHLIKNNL